ncbi:MAG: DUF1192 domain-containing protein [Pseudomonadota bacterium]
MHDDGEAAKKPNAYVLGQILEDHSVDEISDILEALNEEIARLEKIRKEKSSHLSAAEALFKR